MKNKAVVKLGVTDAKSKRAVKKALVDIDGFSSYTLDFEKSTLVMMGDMDPIETVVKLRKVVSAELVTFGPETDEEKPQKNDGGGGKVDQKPLQPVYGGGNVVQKQKQKPPPVYGVGNVVQKQKPPPVYPPFNYVIGPSDYDLGHHYN